MDETRNDQYLDNMPGDAEEVSPETRADHAAGDEHMKIEELLDVRITTREFHASEEPYNAALADAVTGGADMEEVLTEALRAGARTAVSGNAANERATEIMIPDGRETDAQGAEVRGAQAGGIAGVEDGRDTAAKRSLLSDNAKILIKDVIIACVIALAISFFIRPTIVRETSMEPTVKPSDYLIMSRQAYRFGDLGRGDIIIFRSDLKLDETHNKLLIKRVIALPGDTIAVHDGNVYLNGDMLNEEYIAEGGTTGNIEETTLGEGEVFVMGDHREVSVDSRRFGPIDEEDIVGQAVFRLYPFNKMGTL